MLASYRLLSERSRVRLAPGARSEGTRYPVSGSASVANRSAKSPVRRIIQTAKTVITVAVLGVTPLALMAQPAPFDVDATTAGTYEAEWTADLADRFPSCREHREGDVSAAVVVIRPDGQPQRQATDAAYALNTDDERANNVYVVGVCA